MDLRVKVQIQVNAFQFQHLAVRHIQFQTRHPRVSDGFHLHVGLQIHLLHEQAIGLDLNRKS